MKQALLKKLQGDLPLVSQPLTNKERAKIRALKRQGGLRRFGAVLNHRRIGFTSNCMVAWDVAEAQAAQIGRTMAKFDQVSHCYERTRFKGFSYNLYTMIHGRGKNDIIKIVKQISRTVRVFDYQLLWSVRELKKTSPTYVV